MPVGQSARRRGRQAGPKRPLSVPAPRRARCLQPGGSSPPQAGSAAPGVPRRLGPSLPSLATGGNAPQRRPERSLERPSGKTLFKRPSGESTSEREHTLKREPTAKQERTAKRGKQLGAARRHPARRGPPRPGAKNTSGARARIVSAGLRPYAPRPSPGSGCGSGLRLRLWAPVAGELLPPCGPGERPAQSCGASLLGAPLLARGRRAGRAFSTRGNRRPRPSRAFQLAFGSACFSKKVSARASALPRRTWPFAGSTTRR